MDENEIVVLVGRNLFRVGVLFGFGAACGVGIAIGVGQIIVASVDALRAGWRRLRHAR